MKSLSRVRLFATPWTVAHQAPPSMEFSRQEYWSGLPFPSPGDLPNLGIEPWSPTLWADALPSEPPETDCIIKLPKIQLERRKHTAQWLLAETQDQSLGEDPLEEGMTTHSSILAWRIPRTEEPGGL